MPVIGFLSSRSIDVDAPLVAFHQGLADFGFVEGRNTGGRRVGMIDYPRWQPSW